MNTTPTSLDSAAPTSNLGHGCLSQKSDEELMTAIQMEDGRALEVLLERHRGLLKGVILRTVHDHASADDVLQDCLIDIWKQARNYSATKGKPLGWMLTMAKRRAIDYLRRSIAYCSARDRMEEASKIHVGSGDTGGNCEDADVSRVLQENLELLPPPQRQVLSLAFLKGMSQREVAKITNTPLGTVKTRIELGLQKLRAAFRTQRIHTFPSA